MASVNMRYARALADAVFDLKMDVAASVRDLNGVVAMSADSPDLRKVWENPSIAIEQKRAILDALVAQAGISRIVRNFIAVLIDHGRIRNLPLIARQFELELNSRMGFADAEITSVHELGPQAKHDIEQQIERVAGKKVRARYKTRDSLLGGAVIRIGSTVYDGSIQGQLAKIREQLSAN
jgi:F-type H+-transporting ATPase subunit delta